METLVRANGFVRPCCMPGNLVPHQVRQDLVVKQCRVCGARHFELSMEPGRAFAKGVGL